jgi:hypothetical protein
MILFSPVHYFYFSLQRGNTFRLLFETPTYVNIKLICNKRRRLLHVPSNKLSIVLSLLKKNGSKTIDDELFSKLSSVVQRGSIDVDEFSSLKSLVLQFVDS